MTILSTATPSPKPRSTLPQDHQKGSMHKEVDQKQKQEQKQPGQMRFLLNSVLGSKVVPLYTTTTAAATNFAAAATATATMTTATVGATIIVGAAAITGTARRPKK